MQEVRLREKTIFNQDSREDHDKARMVGGNPDGIMDFNGTNHTFFYKLYKQMLARTWFPEQVNISKDKINYSTLTEDEKRAYDLVLSQLIANDSIQANQLADRINAYVTSPVVNAALIRQAWEECCVPDMEVLILGKGWTKLDQLEEDDVILTGNEDGKCYFSKVLHVNRYQKKEDLYKIEGTNISQIVTAEHRLPILIDGKIVVKHAQDVYNEKLKLATTKMENVSIEGEVDEVYILTTTEADTDVSILPYKYAGYVYCPTVEGGLFVTRYNGKISLTGNCNHSESYAVMAEDICQDTQRIYYMHREDPELGLKNKAVEEMYEMLYTGTEPTKKDMLLAATANQLLEGLVFLGGFVVMFSLEHKMPGTCEQITEINC